MKIPRLKQCWSPAVITGLALAASVSMSQAADLISYTFNSDVQSFYAANTGATVSWNATNGVGGGGCLQVYMDGTTTTEIDPAVDVSLNTANYMTVEFDLKIDPNSGSAGTTSTYGNLQVVLRDSSYSWDSIWFGGVNISDVNGVYKHFTFTIPRVSGSYKSEAHLQIQLYSGSGYTAPVTAYFDNIKITPVPNPWLIDTFTNSSEVGGNFWVSQTWSLANGSSLVTSQDAGGGFTPLGALELNANFGTVWGQSVWQDNLAFDPSRWTYLEMDVKVDGSTSTLMSDGTYGFFEPIVIDGSWNWTATTPSGVTVPASAATTWTHVKVALPSLTAANGLVAKLSGNALGPINFFIDNIKTTSPTTAPKIAGLQPGSPGGVKIVMDGAGDQWDREALCVPSSSTSSGVNYTWGGQTPVTYSLTITNFPSPASAPGFESHIFIVNEDTIPAAQSWNETYSGCDWNASDLGAFRVENGTNGGVSVEFDWKTNAPSSNPTNTIYVALPNLASANGTWSLNFTDDTHGNITGPGGVYTNFTLPSGMQANFTTPSVSFLQVGVFKNDSSNAGKSDNQSAIISHVLVTNTSTVLFDDNFAQGLTSNYVWRTTTPARIIWIPQNTVYWLQWSVPDSGFSAQVSSNLLSAWSDAGISYIYTDGTGTNRFGAVISTNLPASSSVFFRLKNPTSP